jgi:hypothetical protein
LCGQLRERSGGKIRNKSRNLIVVSELEKPPFN